MDLGTLLLIVVIGVIFGIIGGALWLILKIFLAQKKAMKDYKSGNMLKIRDSNPETEVPKPIKEDKEKTNKSALSKLFGSKK